LTVQRSAGTTETAAVIGDYRVLGPRRTTTIPCALGSIFVLLSLLNPQRFPHPGVLLNREAVCEAGGYSRDEFPAEDLGLWLRLAQVGRLVGLPHVVVDWRMRPESVSHQNQLKQRQITTRLLSKWRLPPDGIASEVDVCEELQRYETASMAMERSTLLVRDLWTALPYGVPASSLRAALRYVGFRPLGAANAILSLGRDAQVRRAHRGSNLDLKTEIF